MGYDDDDDNDDQCGLIELIASEKWRRGEESECGTTQNTHKLQSRIM